LGAEEGTCGAGKGKEPLGKKQVAVGFAGRDRRKTEHKAIGKQWGPLSPTSRIRDGVTGGNCQPDEDEKSTRGWEKCGGVRRLRGEYPGGGERGGRFQPFRTGGGGGPRILG